MIIWSDDLRTGISIIDEQHEALFKLANRLDKFTNNKDSFYEALIELQTYAAVHFNTEEEYMRYANYPDLEHHKECHEAFIRDYKNILKKISTVDDILDLGKEFISFVENWIKNHYSEEDVKMAEYLKSH